MDNLLVKKLFIFLGVIFFILLAGPYIGIHLLGEPEIPPRSKRPVPMEMKNFDSDPEASLPYDEEDSANNEIAQQDGED